MESRQESASEPAGAYPISDAQEPRLTPVISEQGLPRQERARLKKPVQKIRVGTLNVGSLTGRSRELADVMERRKIGVLCVQETRWKGNKSREIGEGCKLIYSGANNQGRNGVGIILDKKWSENLVHDVVLKKKTFWQQLDVELQTIPQEERVFLGGDLNGHLGPERGVLHRVHGGWGMGENISGFFKEFKEKVMREVTFKEDTNEWWEENSKVIRSVAEEVQGKISGKGMPQGKDTWWWSEEVQVKGIA
ncbi:uncharacterized protein LOC134785169 [Penaeus indicus]|uniref:uncharacterized protein LOC134785169 n=1 Tax=Penaeus indicus TaxID=29960 RepID=UPI00300D3BD7